jgi:hypothetical protein
LEGNVREPDDGPDSIDPLEGNVTERDEGPDPIDPFDFSQFTKDPCYEFKKFFAKNIKIGNNCSFDSN